MSKYWLAVALLILCLVDVTAFWVAHQDRWTQTPNAIQDSLFLALALSQVSLLATWVGLGGGWAPVRLLGMAAGIITWGAVMGNPQINVRPGLDFFWPEDMQSIWTVRFLAQALVVAVPLLIARVGGLRLVDISGPGPAPRDFPRPRRQFSLGYLMTWVTGLAAVLGLLKCVRYRYLPQEPAFWVTLFTGLSIRQGLIALTSIWAAWGTGRPWLRLASVVLGCVVAAVSYVLRPHGMFRWPGEYSFFCAAQAIFLLIQLWIFRMAGCRLIVEKKEPGG